MSAEVMFLGGPWNGRRMTLPNERPPLEYHVAEALAPVELLSFGEPSAYLAPTFTRHRYRVEPPRHVNKVPIYRYAGVTS